MVLQRVITALCLIPFLWVSLAFNMRPWPWFTLVMLVWSLCALFEFYQITRSSGTARPFTVTGMLLALLIIIHPHFNNPNLLPLLLTLAVVVPLMLGLAMKDRSAIFARWAWTLAGVMYLGWLTSYYVSLSLLEMGTAWVMMALMSTFASDISAFFVGRAIGRHKLAPSISPHKTWEGALAGLAGAVTVGLLVSWLMELPLRTYEAVLLALAVSILGQAGDLVESLFKRNTGVKDASHVLPGHGGFLDRIDSVVFAGLVVYYYVILISPL